jgi:hypothetical protein
LTAPQVAIDIHLRSCAFAVGANHFLKHRM